MAAPVRRFGPLKAAGVVIREKKPVQPIVASPMGRVVMAGRFRRGEVHDPATPEINHCPNLETFDLLMGGRDRDQGILDAPLAAEDYFRHAKGAGKVLALRVTDGTQEKASCLLWARRWGTAFGIPQSATDDESQVRIPVLRVKARNGGRWGGRRAQIRAAFSIAGDLTATTLTTGLTLVTNQWAGAFLTFTAVPNRTYEVISNTSGGVLTVKTGSTMKADYDDVHPAGTDKTYKVAHLTKAMTTGGWDALAVRPIRGRKKPSTEFGVEVYVDGKFYRRYDDLSMDPAAATYVETVTKDDPIVEFVDLLAAGIPLFADHRPAAFYSAPATLAAQSVTFPIGYVTKNDTAAAQVVKIEHNGVDPIPHRLKFVWNATTNDYAVTAEALEDSPDADGNATRLIFSTMAPDFATNGAIVGNGAQFAKLYSPGTGIPTVKVTVDHPTEPANGTTFEIDVPGLPREVFDGTATGYVLPDAKNDPLVKFAISAIDPKLAKVTIVAGDLTVAGKAPTQASVTSTIAQNYNIVGGASDKMLLSIDGRADVTVTLTAGAARTAAQIVADIHTAFDAIFGVGVLNPASVSADNKVVLASTWWEGGGPASSVAIKTVANDAYTVLGLTVATTRGVKGDEVELSFPVECEGGHDGGEPADADLIEAFDLATCPLERLEPGQEGMLSLCAPGVTSAAVQKQIKLYGDANNFATFEQIPEATVLDTEAASFCETSVGRGDLAFTYFPSFGDVRDPDLDGSILSVPLCGMILGEIAAMAGNVGGYHHPAAGLQVTLPEVLDLPTGDRVLDEEFLTPLGINVIKKRDANYVIWGARTLSDESLFVQLTQRLQLSHYEHTLSKSLESFIFSLNDPIERAVVVGILDAYFQIEWANRVLYGKGKGDSWVVKADAENNPVSEIEAGNMNVEVTLKFTPFTERLVISIGKAGLFDNVSV